MTRSHDPALTYAGYLKVDELLSLQQPRSPGPEHDGGSSGAEYLRSTLGRASFPDLWAIRAQL